MYNCGSRYKLENHDHMGSRTGNLELWLYEKITYAEPPCALPYRGDLLPRLVKTWIPSIQAPVRRKNPVIYSPRRISRKHVNHDTDCAGEEVHGFTYPYQRSLLLLFHLSCRKVGVSRHRRQTLDHRQRSHGRR